jgi:hypothetical protein
VAVEHLDPGLRLNFWSGHGCFDLRQDKKMKLLKRYLLSAVFLFTLVFTVGGVTAASKTTSGLGAFTAQGICDPLPAPTDEIVNVSNVSELQHAVANLESNTTILIADGTYDLTNTLVIDGGVSDVSIRGASGNRDGVILRGRGMDNSSYGNTPHGFLIRNSNNVLIADLTIQDFYFHNVQIQGEQNAQATHLYNLKLIDAGEQLVKVSSAGPPGPYADDGIVECSYLGYSDRARDWYTNGVDVLAGARWIIRDNLFENIRAPSGQLAGPSILMWRNSIDTLVERNLFLECDRAIAFGLSTPDTSSARDGNATYDHQGGIIRNNIIYREGSGDVGITVNYARDYKIYHNTVILNDTFPYGAIEYRFSASNGEISYNLTDAPIWRRDGASGTLLGNITDADLNWFVDPSNHDLHLTEFATPAIDAAAAIADITDDYDGDMRPSGIAPDIGADEFVDPILRPTFEDVPFDHWAHDTIEALYQGGYVAGCSTTPRMYCPERIMNRAESAVFVVRGVQGADFTPPDPSEKIFEDVPLAEWYAKWATQLWNDGYTAGCGTDPLIYCPLQEHTIAEGSVFYLRMQNGSDYEPPQATGIFTDVPLDAWYARWIEDAYQAGILLPCQTEPELMACPLDPLDRAMGAYMMFQAKGM